MNRKLRVLMLSVFVVLFAAVSAFAASDTSFDVKASPDFTAKSWYEGYPFTGTVVVSFDVTKISMDVVSWEVYATSDDGTFSDDISWLTWTPGSLDVKFEGTLPYSGDQGYHIHVIAYFTSNDKTVSVDVNATENGTLDGLEFSVFHDPISVALHDIYNFSADLVSVDATSADGNIYTVTDGYSVTLTFATSEDQPIAELDNDDGLPNLYLPSWLKYEVLSHDTAYVTKLRIFYSADTAPAEGTASSVRIRTTLLKDSEAETKYQTTYTAVDNDNLTMGWEVSFGSASAISLDVTSYDITAKYGETTSVDFTYHYQVPASITFSPDISADVTITATSTDAATSDDANAGYITLTVTPVKSADAVYSTDMIVTDANGNTATVTLYITVTSADSSSMAITPVSSSITVDVGKSADVTFTATSFDSKIKAWTLGTVPSGITVTSSDSGDNGQILTLTVTGVASGDYSFDVKATDSADNTASAVLYVKVLSADKPGEIGLKVDPVSKSITVKAGGDIVSVDFTALDASGDVAWSFGTLPAGVTMVVANQSGDKVTFGVRASADAPATTRNVTITASDDVKTAAATLTIIVSSDAAPTPGPVSRSLTVTASASTVSVAVGASSNVTLTASNNEGLVKWTIGTQPSGATVAVASGIANATQYDTVKTFTITGTTAGTYSVTITATDSADKTANTTIGITVTGGTTPTEVSVDITPSVTITEVLATALRNALAQLLGFDLSGVPVRKLSDGLVSGTLTANVATANVIRFSAITVSEDGIYIFGVPTVNLTPGYVLHYEAVVATAANDALIEASAEENAGVFIDSNGNQITTVPSNGDVNLAAYFEAGKTYEVTVSATAPDSGTETGVGSASSGCSAGLGAMVSMLAAAFFISKKRA